MSNIQPTGVKVFESACIPTVCGVFYSHVRNYLKNKSSNAEEGIHRTYMYVHITLRQNTGTSRCLYFFDVCINRLSTLCRTLCTLVNFNYMLRGNYCCGIITDEYSIQQRLSHTRLLCGVMTGLDCNVQVNEFHIASWFKVYVRS